MKILAVNGSPKGNQGNTEFILQPFLEGTREAGAQTETIYLKDKKINHCLGCFSCWSKTPGLCVHNDDMPELLQKILQSDIVVYASPLYVFSVTGLMKDFMDRRLPLFTPAIKEHNKRYFHNARYEEMNIKRTVLISNCGFPGSYNFSGLVETFKVMTSNKLTAAILFTQGGLLKNKNLLDLLTPFFDTVRKSGKEIVEYGYIKSETQAILDRDILDPTVYQQEVNNFWKSLDV
jgi:multimeric flavodoxin WrbA